MKTTPGPPATRGKTYFFCSPECRAEFEKDPERYLKSSLATGNAPPAKPQADLKHKHAAHDAAAGHISHDHTQMPMTGDMKAMPPAKSGAKLIKPKDAMQMPGAGGSMMPPGSQGPAPVPRIKMEGMSLPASPVATTPSSVLQSTPGSQGSGAGLAGTGGRLHTPNHPTYTRGARALGGTVVPGPQNVPATPQPKTEGMIPPRAGNPPAELPQKDASNGEKAHD